MNPSFYSIIEKTTSQDAATYRIALHPDSPIYQSHFPGRPITPGACIIQMVQDLAQDHFADPTLEVRHIANLKFLTLLEPQHHPTLEVHLHGTPNHLQATLTDGPLLFAKFTLTLTNN